MNTRNALLVTVLLAGCAFGQSGTQQNDSWNHNWWSNNPPAPIFDGTGTTPLVVASPTVTPPVYGPPTPTLDDRSTEPGKVSQPKIPAAAYAPATPTNEPAGRR